MTRTFLWTLAILSLILLSSCYGYQLYRDSSNSVRPLKYHILNDPDRSHDRMKQYHNTFAQLRLWRRYVDDDASIQDRLPDHSNQQQSFV